MSGHTKGPWTFEVEKDIGENTGGDNFHVDAGGFTVIGGCGCCGSPWIGNIKDAALISAAPDLLEALEDTLNRLENSDAWWIDCPRRGGMDADKIRAAIAKAKGEK